MTRPLALIIDDEPDIRELLEITLARMDVDSHSAANVAEAIERLRGGRYSLCLVDMRLPDGSGMDVLRHVAAHCPETPIAVITAHGNMQTAVEALKAGAFDFVSKPVDLPVLRRLVETALRLETPEAPQAAVAEDGELIGKSEAMRSIRSLIDKLARNQAPVFISGESGTGKELAARAIHSRSPRAERPFVAVNCGAIPQDLMESEFFGHIKGSFTGAHRDKPGLFQSADGGTLFLDEVADLPLSMQVKLLRAIQEKSVRPVGGAHEEPVDVRIISASHKDLAAMVANGEFRQDLFYRIHVIELLMSPLRSRREDIPVMIDHILERLAQRIGMAKPRLDREALKALYGHDFPGNVRELENILERATALCDHGTIALDDLGLARQQASAEPQLPDGLPRDGLEAYLADVERHVITQALERTRWNRTAAARALGISFRALRYRLEKLGLEDAAPAADTDSQ
ncbi:MAG: sigma-54 dependent transcriptional regulator [Gammaproteobacteria bacterium]|nr:sigma-54 dependent transcriptional regulator [Gammaproteobacteria bacterium]